MPVAPVMAVPPEVEFVVPLLYHWYDEAPDAEATRLIGVVFWQTVCVAEVVELYAGTPGLGLIVTDTLLEVAVGAQVPETIT